MAFNPLKEKGTPLEKQLKNWEKLNTPPYNKREVHPYTRTRGILMNGIECEAAFFSHHFARHSTDMDLKKKLAMMRRIEQQQQKIVNWMIPSDESVLEVTIGYEQVAVDLTAILAQTEPDPYVKAALDFALIEDFDHLYRFSNLLELTESKNPSDIVGEYTEIMPGRPTIVEHRHPFDEVRKPYTSKKADILTKLHVLTIVSGEQQTMNFYMNVGNRADERMGRGLYQEIAQIEEQHVSHYESLADPKASWLEMLVLHEYNECFMYYSCMESEVDSRVKGVWEQCLSEEVEHLQIAVKLMQQYEDRDPMEFLPNKLPEQLVIFKSNKEYVRDILASQIDLTTKDTEFVSKDSLPKDYRYFSFNSTVNGDSVPSQNVTKEHIQKNGHDFRIESEGPHPVERMRSHETVVI